MWGKSQGYRVRIHFAAYAFLEVSVGHDVDGGLQLIGRTLCELHSPEDTDVACEVNHEINISIEVVLSPSGTAERVCPQFP